MYICFCICTYNIYKHIHYPCPMFAYMRSVKIQQKYFVFITESFIIYYLNDIWQRQKKIIIVKYYSNDKLFYLALTFINSVHFSQIEAQRMKELKREIVWMLLCCCILFVDSWYMKRSRCFVCLFVSIYLIPQPQHTVFLCVLFSSLVTIICHWKSFIHWCEYRGLC